MMKKKKKKKKKGRDRERRKKRNNKHDGIARIEKDSKLEGEITVTGSFFG